MKVMQLLCLFIIVTHANLFAQNNNSTLAPAARVQALQAVFAAQESTPLFATERNRTSDIQEVEKFHLLQLDEERSSALHHEAPATLSLELPVEGEDQILLQLVRVDRSIPVVIESATRAPVAVKSAVHYQGIVAGDPHSIVAFSVLENEVIGLVSSAAIGGNWVLGRQPAAPGAERSLTNDYVFYQDREIFQEQTFSCSTPDSGEGYLREELAELVDNSRDLSDCVQIYFEVNYDIYQDKGSVQAAVQYVEALFNQVATLYANEQINMTISEVFVWNTPSPYSSTSSGQMLTDFQNQRTSFNGDLAQLLSYRASGGIAVVNGLCHPYTIAKMSYAGIGSNFSQVPTYSWSVMVVAHELGHLLGSQHTHACVWNGNSTAIDGCPGYTEGGCASPGLPAGGGTIMSYCHLSQVGINLSRGFGTQPGNLIRNRVAAATCLSACPAGGGGGTGGGGNPPVTSCNQEQLFLRLQLDTYSPETTWTLTNPQGAVVAQGGPYPKTLANQLLIDTLCLPAACYTFRINDAYNDGICCTYGDGSYTLLDGTQQLIAQGGEFPGTESVSFCLPFEEEQGDDCQSINFNDYTIASYGVNQDIGQHAVQDDGQTLFMANNAWKSIAMSYDITRNTVIAFDFKSTREGEIHGIGFDNNESISYGYTFKVHGTQTWGITNYDNYTGVDWQSYTIPVGEFYVGMADRLFFSTDHDGGSRDGNSWFRNVRIYEGTDCQTGGAQNPESANLDNTNERSIQVAPNPVVNDQFQLQLDQVGSGDASWQILSITGQVLQEKQLELASTRYQENIEIGALARGTYLLRWRDELGEQTVRFAVQ